MTKSENHRATPKTNWLAATIVLLLMAAGTTCARAPAYSIQAIRIADSPGDSVGEMVIGAPKDEKIDTMYGVWLIRGGGHNILFDSGFHRERWFKLWTIKDYLRPDDGRSPCSPVKEGASA